MPSLTDTAIRQAMKRVELTAKQENLPDGEGRGTGRLVLVLKPMPKRVTADWMAQQWRDGKRAKKKLGSYPSMSLAQAREIFKRDFADVIQKGRSIKSRLATERFTASSGDSATAALFLTQPTAIYGGRSRLWPAKLASPRKFGTASRTMRCRTSAPRTTIAGTTCPRSAPGWRAGTSSPARC